MLADSDSAVAPLRGAPCLLDVGGCATASMNIGRNASIASRAAKNPARASFIAPVTTLTVEVCRESPALKCRCSAEVQPCRMAGLVDRRWSAMNAATAASVTASSAGEASSSCAAISAGSTGTAPVDSHRYRPPSAWWLGATMITPLWPRISPQPPPRRPVPLPSVRPGGWVKT